MKILNLIQCTNLGGMEQASLKLMQGLQRRGHELRLLSLNPIGELGPLLLDAGIPHEGLPYLGRGGWRSYPLLRRKLHEIQADALIMTGHHLLGSLALGGFCRGHRILAIHFHHQGVRSRRLWNVIYRVACRKFDAVTFPCDFVRNEAESIYPPIAHLGCTVRNPIDIPRLPAFHNKASARSFFNLPSNRPVIGNAGWLIQRKRFDIFLKVAQAVIAKMPESIFIVAGDGPDRGSLESLARELGISDHVIWLGWQRDMANFYRALDVLLFNSDWDAMGLTPLESMSFGVPVVCSVLHGGLGEVINSNDFGYLHPTHDLEGLATQVVHLLSHPAEAARLGLAGRKRVEAVGRVEPIAEWYERALQGGVRNGADHSTIFSSGPALPRSGRDLASVSIDGSAKGAHPSSPSPTFACPRGDTDTHVAILFNRLGPYHFARLTAAGRWSRTTAVEFSDVDPTYAWDLVRGERGFDRLTLFAGVAVESRSTPQIVNVVESALERLRPSSLAIPGWHDRCAFAALRWCVQRGIPAVIMSETTAWDSERHRAREAIKRRVVHLCAAGLVGGEAHADYMAQLGMPANRIHLGYDVVDNDYFEKKAEEARKQRAQNRRRLGLPEYYFLASARFVEKKNLSRLLGAYALYRRKAESGKQKAEVWSLVLLGDGPLKPALNSHLSALNLTGSVLLPGFKQYDELPVFYALASAFVHASTVEPWGLVVNEAMASGLPVLVSNRCGCAQDLVKEDVNGFTFDPYSIEQLAELMLRLSTNDFPLSTLGAASRQIISEWGPERFAKGLHDAVQTALKNPRPRSNLLDRLLLKALLST